MALSEYTRKNIEFFQAIPWCSALINNPSYTITNTLSREDRGDMEDVLFRETLNTNRTISACLSLYLTPSSWRERIEETRVLMSLNDGINGFAGISHGGVVATILDEMMGLLLRLNIVRDRKQERMEAGVPLIKTGMTGELTVKFLKGVRTPQVVCVVAKFGKIEGRKIWVEGRIEDKDGTSLAQGKALFILTNEKEKL